ncbi:MAG: DUF3857 and transglutaminase domain-containing protein [Opitutus sp.]
MIRRLALLHGALLSWAFGAEGAGVVITANQPVALHEPPAWIETLDWKAPDGPPPVGVAAEILLSDQQSQLTMDGSDFFQHLVIHLVNAQGVRQNSEWSVEYAPEYEKLTWHTLKVNRQGAVVDRLPNAKFKTLQRETGFESKIYSGQATVVTILEDVRVGDVVEVAYTLHSANPVLRGHMTARHQLGSIWPIKRQRVVIHTPTAEPSVFQTFVLPPGTHNLPRELFSSAKLRLAVEKEDTEQFRTLRWEGTSLPAIQFDAAVSPQAAPFFPLLQVSSFYAWSDVAEWGERVFAESDTLPESARTLIEQWKAVNTRPEELLSAAVHWVQDDVRYFAMAVGDHNLRPRPLSEVCASRYGDCKDKALLLSSMLRALGFEAWPALVNTYLRERTTEFPPSSQAFDHAIVAYRWKGEIHFVDATIKGQQGAAGGWSIPPYRTALILRKGELGFTMIPGDNPTEPDSETKDRFTVDEKSGDAHLEVTTSLRGIQADFYRQYLEAASHAEIGDHWFNFISRFYKNMEEVDTLSVKDDRENNIITLNTKYRLPGFVKTVSNARSVALYAYSLRSMLDLPESRRRRWPQAIAGGRFVRHRIEIDLPFTSSPEQLPEVVTAEGIEYRTEKGLSGNRFVSVHDLRLTRDYVDAAQMDRFCDAVDDIMESISISIRSASETAPVANSSQPAPR